MVFLIFKLGNLDIIHAYPRLLSYLIFYEGIKFLLPNFPVLRKPAPSFEPGLSLPHLFQNLSVLLELFCKIFICFENVPQILNWLQILQKEEALSRTQENLLNAKVLKL